MFADPQSRIAAEHLEFTRERSQLLESISVLSNSNHECCAAFGISRVARVNAGEHLAFDQ